MIGQRLLHYEIVEKLGQGGMGVVYKARDTHLDRFVAIKVLPPERVADRSRKARFVQEAKAASALNHPNIIVVHDIASDAGHEFMVMEFVAGRTLDHWIGGKGLPLEEVVKYAIQIADALARAHSAGIVHRDLKPSNVILDEHSHVKVLDFGLAKLVEAPPPESGETQTMGPTTQEGTIVGTAAYMSPEQAQGRKLDGRSDIFSLGSVLYEMVTGRRAFAGDSVVSILTAILRDHPERMAEIKQGLPRDLERIITRCLQKDPNRRYQHAGDLKADLQEMEDLLDSGGPLAAASLPPKPGTHLWLWITAAAACVAISFAAGWLLPRPDRAEAPWIVTRLTSDSGLSGPSALSPDGKLLAYSADHGRDGERDLYVKQVAGGQPIRLTTDGAGNTMPDFSPDGSKIVFRSNRDGGGIYLIPAFGGDARLLARDGLNPRFSPDGLQVAYWVGSVSVSAWVPGGGTVWVVPAAGGQPQQVGPNFTAARFPVWSPDGKSLLLIGYTSQKAFDTAAIDWWLADTRGGPVVGTGMYAALVRAGLQTAGIPRPACWLPANNTAVFSLANGDARNLWEVLISPRTGKVSGAFNRLSTGAGNEVDPSCASNGALAFTNLETRSDIWSLGADLDRAMPKGALERITQAPAERQYASLSIDGRYVAFSSDQAGPNNIWVRDLATGKESIVAGSQEVQRYPMPNASGSRIAYSVLGKSKRLVYVSTPGGSPEQMCEGCLRATDWSRDEKTLLVFGGDPYQINTLDVASHQQTPLLKHPKYNLLFARYSPDGRWVAFSARVQPNRVRIMIAPINEPKPVPESAWIPIADAGPVDWAYWSPDGGTLYFTSDRDGYSCLWAQRIDPASRLPVGEAIAVEHLHGRVFHREGGWSAAGGRIAMVLTEETGNIWMMTRQRTQ